MGNGRKLRRYGRKQYTQVVDFPVEIIGRDGFVRRYDFEQSIQLYQRRFDSAPRRYSDEAIVNAERQHCRKRLEQLRRSYEFRSGWAGFADLEMGPDIAPLVRADLVAFLHRCFDSQLDEPSNIEATWLGKDADRPSLYLRHESEPLGATCVRAFIVKIYPFPTRSAGPARADYARDIGHLHAPAVASEQLETLIAHHDSKDCGFVLSQIKGPRIPTPPIVREPAGNPLRKMGADIETKPYGMAYLRAFQDLREGRHREALRAFIGIYEDSPLQRRAYLGAIVCADLIGATPLAETAAIMGSRLLPRDEDLHYQLCAVQLRLGNWEGAATALASFQQIAPGDARIPLLQAVLHAGRRRYRKAGKALHRIPAPPAIPHPLARTGRRLGAQLLLRRLLLALSALFVIAGLVSNYWAPGWGLGGALVGALIGLSSAQICRKLFVSSLMSPGSEGLRLVDVGALGRPSNRGAH